MLKRYVRILLFLTSYCPLFAIFMIDYYDNAYILAGLAMSCVLSIALILAVFRALDKVSGAYIDIDGKVENTGKYALQYFMAYLIPLLAVGDFDVAYAVKYAAALGIMAYLYIQSDIIYINPTLAIMGYRIYKVSTPRGDAVVITRRRIRDRIETPLVQAVDGVYYERNK